MKEPSGSFFVMGTMETFITFEVSMVFTEIWKETKAEIRY